MKNRRIFVQPDDIIELIEPTGLSALRVCIRQGDRKNTQVLAYSQPGCRLNVDVRQHELDSLFAIDPTPED